MEIFYFCSLFSPPRDSINSKGTLFEFLNSGSMTFNWRKKKWLYLFPLIEASDMRVDGRQCSVFFPACLNWEIWSDNSLSQHDVFCHPTLVVGKSFYRFFTFSSLCFFLAQKNVAIDLKHVIKRLVFKKLSAIRNYFPKLLTAAIW